MSQLLAKLSDLGVSVADGFATSYEFPLPGSYWVDQYRGTVSLRSIVLVPQDAPGVVSLNRAGANLNVELPESGSGEDSQISDEMKKWAMMAPVLFVKAMIAAAKVAERDLDDVAGASTASLSFKASPGFTGAHLFKGSLTTLHKELFPAQALPAIAVQGVVCLPMDASLALDIDVLFRQRNV